MAFPLTGLVSYWAMGPDFLDSHGPHHLINAGVTSVPGKVGTAGDFGGVNQYLSHPDPNPLGDEDYTYALWCKQDAPGQAILIGKDHNANGRSYFLSLEGVTLHWAQLPGSLQRSFPGDTNWHFIVAGYDATTNLMFLQLDEEPLVTVTSAGPSAAPLVPLRIGSRDFPGFEWYFNGLIGPAMLYRRVLTPAERTALWNGGAGLPYPEAATGSAVLTLPPATGPVLTLPPAIGAVLSVPPATGAVLSLPVAPVSGPTYQERILADGAIAYWPLDDPSGTTARDLAGTRHGTISGGVTLNQPGIGTSQCMVFPASGTGKIVLASLPSLSPAFTLEAWVNITDFATRMGLIVREPTFEGDFTWEFRGDVPTRLNFQYIAGSWPIITSHLPLSVGTWAHLVVTGASDQVVLYANGVALGVPMSMPLTGAGGGPCSLGNFTSSNEGWRGGLQDIAIYPRALTPAEIAAHYALRTG